LIGDEIKRYYQVMEYLTQKMDVPNKTHDIISDFYEREYKRLLKELIEEIEAIREKASNNSKIT